MREQVISPERMPERLQLVSPLGPLTIMVPDFADPCGRRRIARTVNGAYPADVWDSANSRYTRSRWQISFTGAYLHPMILVTSGEYRYTITSDAPSDAGGPCALCRAHAHQVAAEKVEQATAREEADRARRAFEDEASHAGHHRGYEHASFVDAYGVQHHRGPSVPKRYMSVATFYLTGWDEGTQAYTDEQE